MPLLKSLRKTQISIAPSPVHLHFNSFVLSDTYRPALPSDRSFMLDDLLKSFQSDLGINFPPDFNQDDILFYIPVSLGDYLDHFFILIPINDSLTYIICVSMFCTKISFSIYSNFAPGKLFSDYLDIYDELLDDELYTKVQKSKASELLNIYTSIASFSCYL